MDSPSKVDITWVQEEARNQGPYTHVATRIPEVLAQIGWEGSALKYVGRKQMEVPAVGAPLLFAKDKQNILSRALALE